MTKSMKFIFCEWMTKHNFMATLNKAPLCIFSYFTEQVHFMRSIIIQKD